MTALSQRVHLFARPELRAQLAAFFTEVLGCAELALPGTTIAAFSFPGGGSASVDFTEDALDAEQAARGTWLELLSDDAAALRAKVLAAGLPQVSYLTGGFYFQSPGGQVWGIPAAPSPTG